jgi:hypothetical protein
VWVCEAGAATARPRLQGRMAASESCDPQIVFLFSNPLLSVQRVVLSGGEEREVEVPSPQLDADTELHEMERWLSESRRRVALRSE